MVSDLWALAAWKKHSFPCLRPNNNTRATVLLFTLFLAKSVCHEASSLSIETWVAVRPQHFDE